MYSPPLTPPPCPPPKQQQDNDASSDSSALPDDVIDQIENDSHSESDDGLSYTEEASEYSPSGRAASHVGSVNTVAYEKSMRDIERPSRQLQVPGSPTASGGPTTPGSPTSPHSDGKGGPGAGGARGGGGRATLTPLGGAGAGPTSRFGRQAGGGPADGKGGGGGGGQAAATLGYA